MVKLHTTVSLLATAGLSLAQRLTGTYSPCVQPNNGTTRRLLGNSFAAPGNAEYDYIVVGAGNTGLPIAVRLAEGGYRTALIESGSFYEIGNSNFSQIPLFSSAFTGRDINNESPQVDWGYVTEPQVGQGNISSFYARGRTMGGSTARNYMAYHRGNAGYYDRWAEMVDDDSWTFDNLLEHFNNGIYFTPPPDSRLANSTPRYELETVNGTGPVSVTYSPWAWAFESFAKAAMDESGLPEIEGFVSGELIGSSNQLLTIDPVELTRESASTSYLRKLGLQNDNLIVYPNTLATRVLFDAEMNAVGIDIDFDGRNYTLNATREVVLSAGAFGSPHLLMVSGIGPAETLEAAGVEVLVDSPGVGQAMEDHVLGGPSFPVNIVTADNIAGEEFGPWALEAYNTYPINGPYSTIVGTVLAFEKLPEAYRGNWSQETLDGLSIFPEDYPEVEYLFINTYYGPGTGPLGTAPEGRSYTTVAVALVAPFSRGYVSINSSDIHDHPIIDPGWLSDPRDVEVAVSGIRRIREFYGTDAMAPALAGPEYFPGTNVTSDEDLAAFVRAGFTTVYHAACTAKMGNDTDPMAVLDSRARVRGAQRLRVADASSMPELQPGHPMASLYMLGERVASDILADATQ